ncbi:MAG: cupin domain-containing protein [Pseudomonadota bacterium]
MPDPTALFDRMLAPCPRATFLADFLDLKPVHVPGSPDKFAHVLSWDALNRMLSMDGWTGNSLELFHNGAKAPPGAYCRSVVNRNRQRVMRPDAGKVMAMVRQGASLRLNEVETLVPEIMALTQAIAQTMGAKTSANVYCSWQANPALDSHCDHHDAYVLHIFGEKAWNIYQGRADNPIEHEIFHGLSQDDYDRMKGPIQHQITLKPGDLLYLPRGQFHDALASSAASMHVTISCTEPVGLDWMSRLWEHAVRESLFRANLPRGDGPEMRQHLEQLCQRFQEIALGDVGSGVARNLRQNFPLEHERFTLGPETGRPGGRGSG